MKENQQKRYNGQTKGQTKAMQKFWQDYHHMTDQMINDTRLYNQQILGLKTKGNSTKNKKGSYNQMGGTMAEAMDVQCEFICPISLDGKHEFKTLGKRWTKEGDEIDLLECIHCLCRKWE